MITKFEKYNESLRDLMVGPTEEEVWNNIKDFPPNELLKKCIEIGFLKGIKLALKKDADIHINNDEPLRLASENGHTEIVKLLLDKGADIHVHAEFSLQVSALNGYIDIVELLLDRGADIRKPLETSLKFKHMHVVELLKKYMKEND